MHVINACRCKYACFFDTLYHYALMKKVETQDFASHKEKSIYSSAYNCLLDCNGVDVRRKILRLYWAVAIIKYWWKLHIIMR